MKKPPPKAPTKEPEPKPQPSAPGGMWDELLRNNPGLTKEDIAEMLDELGF